MKKKNQNEVLVYGTLRPFLNHRRTKVRGRLYDLGSYPGIILDEDAGEVVCEIITVTDAELRILDCYEGFDEDSPRGSLYIRRKLETGQYIYEFNHPSQLSQKDLIESGDWSRHKQGWVTSRLAHVIGKEAAAKASFEPVET